ncbi:hypothetical protein ACT80S_18580 [Ramlibacter sp. MAHUQ-53]|uniref:hypothetical protein n=1 Tax=unclassified Ramlibacter TaxID=2617605 RepID=UPI0036426506
MSRFAYSVAALVVLVALMASHWKVYRMGGAAVLAEQAAQALKASEEARKREQTLSAKVEALDRELQKQKARNVALSRALSDRLRDFEAAASRASEDSGTASGANGPFASIAGECARYLAAMDEYARSLAATAAGLQRYAAEMQLGGK